MKFSIAVASIVALTLFVSVAGFAAEPVKGPSVNGSPVGSGTASPATATDPNAKPQPNDAAINTTRSNIKHPYLETNPNGSAKPTVDNGGRAAPPAFLGNRPIIEK